MRRATRIVPILGIGIAVGCGQLLGTSDYGVSRVSPDASGACEDFGLPAESACRTCQFQQCCAESILCRGEPTCAAFARCLTGCSHDDGTCLAACYATPKTYAIKRWLGCSQTHCGDQCVGCAEPGAAFGAACGTCQVDLACAEHTACRQDPECAAWMGCVTEKCDPWALGAACRVTCTEEHPVGPKFRAWGIKIAACADQCGWGQHWECADPTMPEMPIGDPTQNTTLALTIGTLLGTTALPTLSVKACRDLDGVCGAPVSTDSGGVATVTLNQTGTALASLYTSTFFDLSSSAGSRELVYLGRSLTAAQTFAKVQWLDTTTQDVQASGVLSSGKGVIIMIIADCIGAANIFTSSGNPTATLEGGGAAVYSKGGLPDPTVQSAFQAWFYPVLPGMRTVHVQAPGGRDVYQARIRVDADAVTLLYVNYPVWLL